MWKQFSVFHLPCHPVSWEFIQHFSPYRSCKGHGKLELEGAQSFLIPCATESMERLPWNTGWFSCTVSLRMLNYKNNGGISPLTVSTSLQAVRRTHSKYSAMKYISKKCYQVVAVEISIWFEMPNSGITFKADTQSHVLKIVRVSGGEKLQNTSSIAPWNERHSSSLVNRSSPCNSMAYCYIYC